MKYISNTMLPSGMTEYEHRAWTYLNHWNKHQLYCDFLSYQFWFIAATFGISQARKEI